MNKEGELFVMKNNEPIVGFSSDYAYELYLSMHYYYSAKHN